MILNPKVILILGTSGSGKTTWAKTLDKNKYHTISLDDMRIEFTSDINDKSKDNEIYEILKIRTIKILKEYKNVIIDSTNLQKKRRRDFIKYINTEIPNVSIEYKLIELNNPIAKERIKKQLLNGEKRANVSDETIDRHTSLYIKMVKDIKEENIKPFQPF